MTDRDSLVHHFQRRQMLKLTAWGAIAVGTFSEAAPAQEPANDREFMGWIKSAVGKTMGDAVDEWKGRKAMKRPT
ncbi:DUF6434 domain-containing protein [Agrobacterium rubi]|uniref:DUF6434 domain-containing protein n=1 Tax=Agrobacterium rubi TaxID=28099 RepID=A0AAE7UQL0_9HYPH|nr:DUF6434 domain-containing protein [Agrobacterium rubi]NTE89913.1 hypothetical protein [Agrobacterium rubi]NTF05754.1 hypothetical protein [Agrobacterium rubi]NTF40045.1 hypothetical protein [Agrobacterium rubi]OCJ50912.1 hypothetical protein A6U92_04440 [Agrobacterium rubi]QTG03098.1 hypothetical protein G6M88_22385 [Agrobacterium rubi]